MKKLLTLTALIAGVALFAGCMNQPTEEVVDETTPVVEEVVTDTVAPEATVTTGTEEVMPEATAE